MNKELKKLLNTEIDTYPSVYQKIASGTMTYDQFFEWADMLTTQRYFQGKQAVMIEHKKDIPYSVRKIYQDQPNSAPLVVADIPLSKPITRR
jgi:hypothetical protein